MSLLRLTLPRHARTTQAHRSHFNLTTHFLTLLLFTTIYLSSENLATTTAHLPQSIRPIKTLLRLLSFYCDHTAILPCHYCTLPNIFTPVPGKNCPFTATLLCPFYDSSMLLPRFIRPMKILLRQYCVWTATLQRQYCAIPNPIMLVPLAATLMCPYYDSTALLPRYIRTLNS